jgi:hypothetical protein
MDKVVWKIFEPVVREHLVQKYVPREPIDPLVIQIVALYWMFQELVKFWKTKQRLTFEQKKKVLHLLIWNLSRVQQEQAAYNEYQSDVMFPGIETLTEDEIGCQGFNDSGESVPHAVDVHDVAFGETSDEEEYDTAVSSETAEQIAQLVLACKEFELKVA